jgi:hypothetical protein
MDSHTAQAHNNYHFFWSFCCCQWGSWALASLPLALGQLPPPLDPPPPLIPAPESRFHGQDEIPTAAAMPNSACSRRWRRAVLHRVLLHEPPPYKAARAGTRCALPGASARRCSPPAPARRSPRVAPAPCRARAECGRARCARPGLLGAATWIGWMGWPIGCRFGWVIECYMWARGGKTA